MRIDTRTLRSILLFSFVLSACGAPRIPMRDADPQLAVEAVASVNTPSDELAPSIINGSLYFVSDRRVERDRLHRLYMAADHARANVQRVSVQGQDVRMGSLSTGGGLLYFGQCYRDDGVGDCDICSGRLSSDGLAIDDVTVLPAPVNNVEWDHHPALSPDGSMLVFASERFGGHGRSDLWMSRREGRTWSAPVNLGPLINTSGNEMTPSFSADGQTLYFASDNREGYGGFDLYASRKTASGWGEPSLLPPPYNSTGDDIFLHGGVDVDTSYISSNRAGGSGGYDIYRIIRLPPPPPPPVVLPLVLSVHAENAFTREGIAAEITISDADSDEALAEGVRRVECAITPTGSYSVVASLQGFMSSVLDVRAAPGSTLADEAKHEQERRVISRVVSLTPVTEEERIIYAFTVEFDFDLFDIRPEEQRRLDSVVVLLSTYPNSTVVISGHTDSVGTEAYNIKLGYNRATEVSRYVSTYLSGKNVVLRNPMDIRTYGETQPIATNSTEEGRQRNRRVEIAIMRNE